MQVNRIAKLVRLAGGERKRDEKGQMGVRAKYLHKLSPAQQANIDSSFE